MDLLNRKIYEQNYRWLMPGEIFGAVDIINEDPEEPCYAYSKEPAVVLELPMKEARDVVNKKMKELKV